MTETVLSKAEARFGAWQRGLVFEKKRYKRLADKGEAERAEISKRQQALHVAVVGGPNSLGTYLRRELGLGLEDRIDAPPLTRPQLTVSEYLNPPVELEEELGRAWTDEIPARLAAQPVFWATCHIEWIEQGRLGAGDLSPYLLDGPNNPDSEGKTRNFLRRSSGIFVRAKTSVFSDCTLARAWWRHHLSGQVAQVLPDEVSRRDAHRALHSNRPAWERFVMDSLRRLVSINHPRARAAIVRQMVRELSDGRRVHEDQVHRMGVALARLGLRNSLAHLGTEVLARTAAEAIRPENNGGQSPPRTEKA